MLLKCVISIQVLAIAAVQDGKEDSVAKNVTADLLGTIASKYVTVQKFLNVAERMANVFTADVSQATQGRTAKKNVNSVRLAAAVTRNVIARIIHNVVKPMANVLTVFVQQDTLDIIVKHLVRSENLVKIARRFASVRIPVHVTTPMDDVLTINANLAIEDQNAINKKKIKQNH